jgi:exopolysaccharide biosynthesis polyprenyl glycosylphosphotransferase
MIHAAGRRLRAWRLARLAGDVALGLAAFYGAFWVRLHVELPFTGGLLPPDRLGFFHHEWLAVLLVQLLCLYFLGFYDPPQPAARLDVARRLLLAVILVGGALTGWFFLADRAFPRSVLLLHVAFDYALLLAWRLLLQRFYRLPERRVAIVGSGTAAREIGASIARRHWHGLRVVGHLPAPGDPAPETPPAELGPLLGDVGELARRLAAGEIDDVILVADERSWQTRLVDRLAAARPDRATVLMLPGPFESLIGRMRYRWVHDIPLIEVVRESEWRINRPLKRLLDLVAGGLLALLGAPLLAGAALLVAATAGRPVLYRQTRVGRGRRPFTLWKLRTMRVDAETDGGERLAQTGDPRLIRVGGWLRRLRLDELPQLWNVLAGSMSLVGPRPERPGFVERYQREIPGYGERFSVTPGLTGLAQVNGDYHSSAQNKLRYDLAYIANWSLWLDLSILFRTVKIVLTSRGT